MIPLSSKNPSIDFIDGIDISNPQDGQTIVYDAASKTWKNANGGGGGSGSLITPTYTYDSSTDTYSCDKTFAEIAAAIEAGKCIAAKMSTSDTDYYYRIEQKYTLENGGSGVRFSATDLDEDGVYYTAIAHYISNGVESIEYDDLQYPDSQ